MSTAYQEVQRSQSTVDTRRVVMLSRQQNNTGIHCLFTHHHFKWRHNR